MDWERQSKHDMDAQLDDQQRQVIDDIIRNPDKKYWINGVAGTGKSIVLLRIAEQLRLREDKPSLLLVTYTNALARMFEELLDIESYAVVKPYVRLSEQQEAQSLMNAGNEQVAVEAGTPAGIAPDDFTGP